MLFGGNDYDFIIDCFVIGNVILWVMFGFVVVVLVLVMDRSGMLVCEVIGVLKVLSCFVCVGMKEDCMCIVS